MSWRYFSAPASESGGRPMVGRHDPAGDERNCELLHPDGRWRASDYLVRHAARGQEIVSIYNPDDPAFGAGPATRTGPVHWQYFTIVYGDGPFDPAQAVLARRDLGADDLNCQVLDNDGQWHDSRWREREQLLGDDGLVTDCTAQQMFELILQAQVATDRGRFSRFPSEPLGN